MSWRRGAGCNRTAGKHRECPRIGIDAVADDVVVLLVRDVYEPAGGIDGEGSGKPSRRNWAAGERRQRTVRAIDAETGDGVLGCVRRVREPTARIDFDLQSACPVIERAARDRSERPGVRVQAPDGNA